MKQFSKIFFIAIMVMAIFSSCKKDETPEPTAPTSNNPQTTDKVVNFLSVGNKWVYDVKYYDEDNYYYAYAIDTIVVSSVSNERYALTSNFFIYDIEYDELLGNYSAVNYHRTDANFYYATNAETMTEKNSLAKLHLLERNSHIQI